ncbi:MAG: hypothetical protein QOD00_1339 [Blastocatellia bacterium]|jgi:hypothetical protein|nr:hypothetical protein [Blastocatellia bacterium]
MVMLLNNLAHHVTVWANGWLSADQPRAKRYANVSPT